MPYPQITETNLRRLAQSIRELWEGRSHAYGTFTLDDGETSTIVTAPNCSPTSEVLFSPKTADAAAEIAAGGMYVSSRGQGEFTVTHANDASTTRTFAYRIVG